MNYLSLTTTVLLSFNLYYMLKNLNDINNNNIRINKLLDNRIEWLEQRLDQKISKIDNRLYSIKLKLNNENPKDLIKHDVDLNKK